MSAAEHDDDRGRHVVCRVEELPPGGRRIVSVGGLSIGVFNVNGRYYGLNNRCPHKAAPLCAGLVTGLVTGPEPYQYQVSRPGEILRCPWHGWEFDITNGRSVFNPHKLRVRSYEVAVEPIAGAAADATSEADAEPVYDGIDAESVPTYPVVVEDQVVVLYVRRRVAETELPVAQATNG